MAARDRAMLELLYAGALRVSELVTATLEDLKLETGYMLVRGKGDKERIVPLGKPAQDALTEYSRSARPVLAAMRLQASEEHNACRRGQKLRKLETCKLEIHRCSSLRAEEKN